MAKLTDMTLKQVQKALESYRPKIPKNLLLRRKYYLEGLEDGLSGRGDRYKEIKGI